MATVRGACETEYCVSVCGTLSSRMRNLSLGMPGIGLPWGSITCTSTFTILVSALKLASESVSFPLVALGLSLEGTAGRVLLSVFVVASAAATFRGLAPVSLLVPGLSCAHTPTIRVNAAAVLMIQVFIRTLLSLDDTRNRR